MNTHELYQLAKGAGPKEKSLSDIETEEAIKHQEAKLHNDWLHNPMTLQFLADTKINLDGLISTAIEAATSGRDDVAARLLIKAKALKEVISYARRERTSN